MERALAAWSPEELRQLATLFHRMVDDFLAYKDGEETPESAEVSAAG